MAGGINLFAYVQSNPVNLIDPYGLIDLPGALRAGAGFIGNSLGTVGGTVLAVGTGGAGAVLGGAVVFKSAYGAAANLRNLVAAIKDETSVSRGTFLNDLADLAAPCNEDFQNAATAADLTLDLLSLRASRLATVPHIYNPYGYRILEGGGKFGGCHGGRAKLDA